MRKLMYSIGVTMFLAFLTFHVTISLTNPFYGVSMEALAQGSGSGGSDGGDENWYKSIDDCGNYFNSCKGTEVIKCNDTGWTICDISEQWPCAVVCP
ncbi:hypothetical protein KUV50_18920 [Membranicola marinus]|uniref:Uncharacterized protein n=1 Tax=Membranihabitans marinus TaxID=1227546 RepID=A0A953HY17_9BACT|nr:hypothetical protein [Membranihabitans marinus]MBY5960231.1 hypothetical protein [Membranihabitans marinus]